MISQVFSANGRLVATFDTQTAAEAYVREWRAKGQHDLYTAAAE